MNSAMKVTALQSDSVGRVIDGRFSLLQWLGGSGRSSVFLTELPGEPPQKAAIKFMPADAGTEARIAFAANASRSHASLARVLQSGSCQIDGATYEFIVTEFADEVLSEILPVRALAPEEVKEMLVPVLDALGDLHGHGLVHGRLKPSNVLVVNEELKLSADSIQLAGDSADETHALTIHDAPELADGTVTPASDIWSLGVMIVESLTQGTPDWNRSAHRDVQISDVIPQPFAAATAACLRVDPARRATLSEIRNYLGIAAPVIAPITKAAPPKPAARVEAKPAAPAQQKPAPPAQPRPAARVSSTPAEPIPAESVPSEHTGSPKPPRALSRFDEERESRRKPRGGVLLLVVLILAAIVAFMWSRSHGTLPATKSHDEPLAQSPAPAPVLPETHPEAETPQATPEPEQQPSDTTNAPPVTPQPAPAPAQGNTTARGAVAQRVMPAPLPGAMRTIHGKVNVSVRVNVGPAGEVSDARFDSAGPSRYFAEVAMKAARQWKFTPALSNGQPIASAWTLHFVFTRENVDVTPEQTAP